jgi:hypothetical protein
MRRRRDLAINDERFIENVLAMQLGNIEASADPKTHARAAGRAIALDRPLPISGTMARGGGHRRRDRRRARRRAPTVGPRAVSAAPELAPPSP